jgi:hypothetical protein
MFVNAKHDAQCHINIINIIIVVIIVDLNLQKVQLMNERNSKTHR